MDERAGLTEKIRARALELGFDEVGVSPAGPLGRDDYYLAWLGRGFAGEMDYLQRNLEPRLDPRAALPGARSIVSVALNYYPGDHESAARPGAAAGLAPGATGNGVGGRGPGRASANRARVDGVGAGPDDMSGAVAGVGGIGAGKADANGDGPGASAADPGAGGWSLSGRVARYAWGSDYHAEIRERLEALAAFMRDLGGPEARTRLAVDTSALLERELASRTGIGWFGKNTNLVSTRLGMWCFLGEILTTLELAYDLPHPDRCGSCTRCVEACPTEALTPHTMDATRCISYLTIEHRGSIPRALREGIGDWVFGCDLCLEVCPWNRFARPSEDPMVRGRVPGGRLDAEGLLRMSEEEFRRQFRGTALTRAKRRGLQRNAAVVLGNLGDPTAVPALVEALGSPDPLVRGHAAWALGQIGGATAEQALRQTMEREEDAEVREEIGLALEAAAARQRGGVGQAEPGERVEQAVPA
ncbi:MAG: tRNA epoxyqueuosine(34) reductase QueG [Deltaproteobacteria bacterium]|nr:tRNA epoxyqueuosine(34) reductase QueG [Deltaproteobacteria bacterium]MBI3075537.1 tRNA epoxyqueuosine(34) reductase QueG [Deltaproteobacteria bacterium]